MNTLIEPNFWAKLKSIVWRKIGEEYPEDDWRHTLLGKEGSLCFKYYSKTFELEFDFDEDGDSEYFQSSRIQEIEEEGNSLRITTHNSIYAFEIIKKNPPEDTSDYYAHLTKK